MSKPTQLSPEASGFGRVGFFSSKQRFARRWARSIIVTGRIAVRVLGSLMLLFGIRGNKA
jgi:hypothetical protein